MIGTTLDALVDKFRMEIGASTQPAQGVAVLPTHQHIVRRTQDWLYEDYTWPHLQFDYVFTITPGERYYSFPTNVNPFRVLRCDCYYNGIWMPVTYGFDRETYNWSDPQKNQAQDPVLRWRRYNDQTQGQQQFEIWPVPTMAYPICFRVVEPLPPLIAGSDRAVIDDTLITLIAAAEYLTSKKDPGAAVKQAAAKQLYQRLKGNMDDLPTMVMGGLAPPMQESPIQGAGRWFPLRAKGA